MQTTMKIHKSGRYKYPKVTTFKLLKQIMGLILKQVNNILSQLSANSTRRVSGLKESEVGS